MCERSMKHREALKRFLWSAAKATIRYNDSNR